MPKILLIVLGLAVLSACNTMQGAGRDVSAAGDALTDEATDAERDM
jgi:entericidin B